MTTTVIVKLTTREVCQSAGITEELLHEIVAQGIIQPRRRTRGIWEFDADVVSVARRAVRLQRELDVDWPATAIALDLLDELDQLREENRRLRRRLARFLEE